jgi:adenylylsulfate kinase-like enzyme
MTPTCNQSGTLQEYGLSKAQIKSAERRIEKGIAAERRRGTVKHFTGTADALRD